MKQIYALVAEDPVAVGRVALSRGFDGHGEDGICNSQGCCIMETAGGNQYLLVLNRRGWR